MLVDYLKGKGHDLFTDQFYTSVELADELTKMGFSLTGTIQKNSKITAISFRKNEKIILAWMDKRIVYNYFVDKIFGECRNKVSVT